MHLPKPIYNSVPTVYFVMGIATIYFVFEAMMLEKGIVVATTLYVSALVNRPGFRRHLRALQCNCSGGDHEWEAVYGGV